MRRDDSPCVQPFQLQIQLYGVLFIDIRMGIDGTWSSLISGEADTLDIDPIRGIVTVHGRDLTARMIQARTRETFQNQTSSDIAALLASRNGLQGEITTTSTPVGRYYQIEHDRTMLDQFSRAVSEWDLLVFLARREGFDVAVRGTTLHFRPPDTTAAPALALTPADLVDLRLERSLTLARDIEVTVKSWNSRDQKAIMQTVRGSPEGLGQSIGRPLQYAVVRPNLTPDEALRAAEAMLAELSQHERVITLTMPGELAIGAGTQITLSGTGTDFDQAYCVTEIERSFDPTRGFRQQIRAKNASPTLPDTSPQ
jgi:phage protein D